MHVCFGYWLKISLFLLQNFIRFVFFYLQVDLDFASIPSRGHHNTCLVDRYILYYVPPVSEAMADLICLPQKDFGSPFFFFLYKKYYFPMIIFCKLHQDLSSHFVNRCPTAASTTYSSTPPNLSNEINNNHNIIMIWKKKWFPGGLNLFWKYCIW